MHEIEKHPELWQEYKNVETSEERKKEIKKQLSEIYYFVLRTTAWKFCQKWIRDFELKSGFEDKRGRNNLDYISSLGYEGLLKAIDDFNIFCDVPFLSFAPYKIKWGIYKNWIMEHFSSEKLFFRNRLFLKTEEKLKQLYKRNPTKEEVLDEMGFDDKVSWIKKNNVTIKTNSFAELIKNPLFYYEGHNSIEDNVQYYANESAMIKSQLEERWFLDWVKKEVILPIGNHRTEDHVKRDINILLLSYSGLKTKEIGRLLKVKIGTINHVLVSIIRPRLKKLIEENPSMFY